MANTFNSGTYAQSWASKLQERLAHPTNWKEVCDVRYSDTHTLNVPYMSTTPSVQTGTRGTAFAFQDFALTNETLAITTYRELAVYIDRADLAQVGYELQMDLADRQGQLINEVIESLLLAQHTSWTNIGDTGGGAIGLSGTAFTVSANNIDDVIRAIKREIRTANGWSQATRNGIFIIWRPADFELLEAFVQANGFTIADAALKDGILEGFRYMDVDHYVSNDHTAGHLFAGVKKIQIIGINRTTWGQLSVIQNPAGSSNNNLSGVGMHVRADVGFLSPTGLVSLIYDVNVN